MVFVSNVWSWFYLRIIDCPGEMVTNSLCTEMRNKFSIAICIEQIYEEKLIQKKVKETLVFRPGFMWRSWLAQVYVHSHYWHPISSVSWVILLNRNIQQMKHVHLTKLRIYTNLCNMKYIYEKFYKYIAITGTQPPL